MNKMMRRLVSAAVAVFMLGASAGCGRTRVTLEKYPDTVVATLGDTKIYLDEVNYMARASQYTNELYYAMYGMDPSTMWQSDLGTGTTMETYSKESVMKGVYQTYVLKAKAEELGIALSEDELKKVDEAASQTMKDMDEAVKDATNITEERLKEIITANALAMKAYQEAIKDVDTEVSDEEAAQRIIRYVLVKDGEDAEAAKTQAEEIKGRVEGGENSEEAMKAIAEENENFTYNTNTYGAGDFDNEVGNLGMSLKTGETGSVYQEGYGWYVVYCETDFDREATDNEKPTIISKRQSEKFQTVYAEWVKEMPSFKVDEKVWSQIVFDSNLFKVPETTAAPETTSAGETGTSGAAETAEETSAAAETDATQSSAAETAGE
ncbi:MAG: hypothetical protein HFI63_10890 [Lachnospiraceae bacterium]|nr:hypothetical protein [Lachnospiraceae bacterium]